MAENGIQIQGDIYKDVHLKMMTSEISSSLDGKSEMESNGKFETVTSPEDKSSEYESDVVDMSGALNATAALSASSALKVNEIETRTESEQPSNVDTESKINSSGLEQFVNFVTNEGISQEKNDLSTPVDFSLSSPSSNQTANTASHKEDSSIMTSPLRPEAFIDGIEKFVNFVSKEVLTKKKNDDNINQEKAAADVTSSGDSNIAQSEKSDVMSQPREEKVSTETKTIKEESGKASVKKEHESEDNVDEDLKSYAMAVTDMLDNEVEIAADGNELDAEIKTMVVSNDDGGEIKMTFTDSAVGRFETIGKNDDAMGTLADGLSPLRKSSRAKKRKIYEDFDQADIPYAVELENVVDEVSKAIEDGDDIKLPGPSAKQKSKRKNPSPKKAKLTVEEVYDSDSNEESDGDINKDLLKVRMAKCDICDKHFLDKKKLDEHKKRHKKKSSQSDYPCVVCGKIFLKREHWRRHVKIHDDVRPYACPVCKKGFRRKEHVKRHMLIHTGEKPFECMFCSQRYQRADHLKKHLQQHTRDDYKVKKRKGEPAPRKAKAKIKRRKPTAKAAKLVAKSRSVKQEVDFEEDYEDEDHYSDGLSDEPNETSDIME